MARPSRPPGFDMTYRPRESLFGPPLGAKVPSYVYLGLALAAVALVVVGERAPAGSWLFYFVVEQDVGRVMSVRTFATCLVIGSIAAVLQASMRGVRVYADGVEAREIHNLVVPRVRRYKWPQMECVVLDQPQRIALDLWDGTRAFLPRVRDRQGLSTMLEQVATARAIPIRGGQGLDDLPDPAEHQSDPSASS